MGLMAKFTVLILTLLLFSCVTEGNKEKGTVEERRRGFERNVTNRLDVITVLFEKAPLIKNDFEFTKDIVIKSEFAQISIFGSTNDKTVELPKSKVPDRLILKPEKKYVILRHQINYLDYNDYMLMEGDSVVINYSYGTPLLKIVNRKSQIHDYSFEDVVRNQLLKGQYSPVAEFFSARTLNAKRLISQGRSSDNQRKVSLENAQKIYSGQISAIKNALYKSVQLYLTKENDILDSLYQNKLISGEPYKYYKNKIETIDCIVRMETGYLSKKDMYQMLTDGRGSSDDYLPIYRWQFIESFVDNFVATKAKVIEVGDGRNRDFKQVYTIVDNNRMFRGQDKKYLLYRELKNIAEVSSNDDFVVYFKKYEAMSNDKKYIDKLRNEYSIKLSKTFGKTSDLFLRDYSGKELSLDDLKKKHAGKVIYIDFWASWCVPCRMALPKSANLRSELRDKEIVFIYLSIDKTAKPWQVASINEQLHNYVENYIVANYELADFVKRHKINTIPRYMIFNKTGELTYANAPGVENRDLKPLLIKLSKM